MPYLTTGPSKGNRRPTVAIPGSKGGGRPTAQKGGGGNKAAGSVEPTAANTPTVTVHPDGSVTAEHFSPKEAGRAAAEVARQRAHEAHVKRVVALVTSKPERKPVVAKGTEPKAPKSSKPTKAKTESPLIAKGYTKAEREVLAEGGVKVPKAQRTVTVAEHTRKAPEPKPKGTQPERKAARAKLQKAKQELRTSKPRIEGDLGPEQKKFVLGVAKQAHLNPRTIAAQARAEESEGAQTEAEQTHNFLNMGPGIRYPSLKAAVKATAQNYNTGPYEGVRATRGKPPAVQAKAIAESPWGTGPLIEQTLSEVHVKPGNPKAVASYRAAVKKAESLGMKVGKPAGDVSTQPGTHTVKVRADAQGMVKWAESVQGTKESTARQLRWASNEGLGAGEPWCANFVSNGLLRRGIKNLPSNPNYVPSYESDWAGYSIGTTDLAKAKPGDLITFSGEHIGLYVGNGEMISGNFGDEVSRDPVSADSNAVSMILRPPYKGGYVEVKETTPLPGSTNPTGSVTSSSAPAAVSAVAAPSNPTRKQRGKPKARLSAPQKIRQAEATLAAGDLQAGKGAEGPSTSTLDALAKKYGAAA